MLGQGEGLVNAQFPQSWYISRNLRAAVVTFHPRLALALSQCISGMVFFLLLSPPHPFLAPSTQPAKHQHKKLFTSTFCWPPAYGGKAKGNQKPVNKSANKQWIHFPGCVDPCPRLRAGWIPLLITQDQFPAHFCCVDPDQLLENPEVTRISPACLWPLILYQKLFAKLRV